MKDSKNFIKSLVIRTSPSFVIFKDNPITCRTSLGGVNFPCGTSSSTASVALQGDALLVVFDPQHAALLLTRRLWRTPGQDHPDLPAVHVQVSALPHVHVLRFELLRTTLSVKPKSAYWLCLCGPEGYVSVWHGKRVFYFPVDRSLSIVVLLIELWIKEITNIQLKLQLSVDGNKLQVILMVFMVRKHQTYSTLSVIQRLDVFRFLCIF